MKSVRLGKGSDGVLPGIELRPAEPAGLAKEPRYRSSEPQKFFRRFGDGARPAGGSEGGDGIWIGKGSPSVEKACVEAFPIGKCRFFKEETEFSIGSPLKIRIATRMRKAGTGLVASLSFSIEGSAGEICRNLLVDGKKWIFRRSSSATPAGKAFTRAAFRCAGSFRRAWIFPSRIGEPPDDTQSVHCILRRGPPR